MNTKLPTLLATLSIGAALISSEANAGAYAFADLGTLPGWDNSRAYAINNVGQVVGWSHSTGNDTSHATLWNGTTATDLDFGTSNERVSRAFDINDVGQVVGDSWIGNAYNHVTIWNGSTATDLGAGTAYAINNAGQVAGYAVNTSTGAIRAMLWNGSTATDLNGSHTWSTAFAINDGGQVAGETQFATLWNGTSATYLGTPNVASVSGEAHGINNAGQVVGMTWVDGVETGTQAMLWNGTTPIVLGTLGGSSGFAEDINNNGQIVGTAHTIDNVYHATLWNDTTAIDLNSFLDASSVSEGWVLKYANGINDDGWIVGDATNTITGQNHAFLLTPVPEPETYAMFLVGLGLVGLTACRRKSS